MYVPKWPLIVHLLSACFCLGSSAIFHLFHIHSHKTCEVLSRLDYGGISVLVMGSSYPLIFYTYSCQQVLTSRVVWLSIITFTSLSTFTVTMMPSMNKPEYRSLRGYMFIILGLSAALPLIFTNFYDPAYIYSGRNWMWALGGAVYIGGALIYVFRIPERWYPTKFDLAGSSHNIFHVAVVLGCSIHFSESLSMYRHRQELVCPIEVPGL